MWAEIKGDKNNGYWVKFESQLITDRNGKLNLKQTTAMLEEKIGWDIGEDVEITIKRLSPFEKR